MSDELKPEAKGLTTDEPSGGQEAAKPATGAGEAKPVGAAEGVKLPPIEKATQTDPLAGVLKEQDAKEEDAEPGKDGQDKETEPDADVENLVYELPSDFVKDDEGTNAFNDLAKKLKLKSKDAQQLVDLHARMQINTHNERVKMIVKQDAEWKAEVEKDPEIGGENMKRTLHRAALAMDRFGGEKVTEQFVDGTGKQYEKTGPKAWMELVKSGMGSNPGLLRMFERIGAFFEEAHSDGHNAPERQVNKSEMAFPKDNYPDLVRDVTY